MPELHWTEIDGVTTVWVDAAQPTLSGALLFRTGRADESLVTRGQTHLIEHLILSSIEDTARRNNGFVDNLNTGFSSSGAPEDLAAFFDKVCAGLAAIPAARLEAEKEILGAEAARLAPNLAGLLLRARYGVLGHGLAGTIELGIQGATMEQLRARAAAKFTRENALLWLNGPPPAGLRLQLPPGARIEPPPLQPLQRTFPCWSVDDRLGGIAASSVLRRAPGATLLCAVLSERLRDTLRTGLALSYAPSVGYDPITARSAHLIMHGDSKPENRIKLAHAFLDILDGLGSGLEPDLERCRKLLLDGLNAVLLKPEAAVLQELQTAVRDYMLGCKHEPLEAAPASIQAVTVLDLEAQAKTLHEGLIVLAPTGTKLRPSLGERLPLAASGPVEGKAVPSVDAPIRTEQLVSAAEGVTLRAGERTLTIRYDALAGALSWNDGLIVLVDRDGFELRVEPTLWVNGQQICREIRGRVPKALLIERGQREAKAIPKPAATALQRWTAHAKTQWPAVAAVGVGVSLAVAGANSALVTMVMFGALTAYKLRQRRR